MVGRKPTPPAPLSFHLVTVSYLPPSWAPAAFFSFSSMLRWCRLSSTLHVHWHPAPSSKLLAEQAPVYPTRVDCYPHLSSLFLTTPTHVFPIASCVLHSPGLALHCSQRLPLNCNFHEIKDSTLFGCVLKIPRAVSNTQQVLCGQ